MNRVYDYIIAGIRLRSDINIVEAGVRGFSVFEATESAEHADCHIHIDHNLNLEHHGECVKLSTSYVLEADADSHFMRTEDGYLYSITRRKEGAKTTLFHIDTATNEIRTNIETKDGIDVSILRFGIWVMFGIVIAPHSAIAIHSSVIESEGRGVLFLGESGTGKSTHTRLWRENIEGAHLLNDDSPIIRVIDGEPIVFGSPWSGKTPCYRDLSYPIAGFCRLSQAPHNAIRRLNVIASLGALLPSCPPQFANDAYLQENIYKTLDKVLRKVGVYHLECLPNGEAAHLSHSTIIGGNA
jgi:hypothetical protein